MPARFIMKNLYDEHGWLDWDTVMRIPASQIYIVGGRGIGKTYGALKWLTENNIFYMYMRRTQSQADLITTPEFSIYKQLNADLGWSINPFTITKYNSEFAWAEPDENGKLQNCGDSICYTAALSTFANVRGFGAEDVKVLLYDEFIPEKHERLLRHEYDALMNAYETINRNRELKGHAPLKMICLSNANDLANPIFIGAGIVEKAVKMLRNRQEYSLDEKRGIAILNLQHSPISAAKRNTALYRATAGTEFSKMAIDNTFVDNINVARSKPLQEYKPLVMFGELCIYEHKSKREFYATTHSSGTPERFDNTDADKKRAWLSYKWVYGEYLRNNITFETYMCEKLLTKYFE